MMVGRYENIGASSFRKVRQPYTVHSKKSICPVIDTKLIIGLLCIDYRTIRYMIPINLVIYYAVIDAQNVHPIINLN